ncbi:GIY-YIG nuclease family protein [Candidatus Bathyarchaeota archaeon]|nr:GIY-YIG nuclease family protein [Candidatus Bathyarchaeota archaeon]
MKVKQVEAQNGLELLSTFSGKTNSPPFLQLAEDLVRNIHCRHHVAIALEQWKVWCVTNEEEAKTQARHPEPARIGKRQEQHRERPQTPRADATKASPRILFGADVPGDSGNGRDDASETSSDDDSHSSADPSPTSNSVASADHYWLGETPRDTSPETPLTIPDKGTPPCGDGNPPTTPSLARRSQANETPTRPGWTITKPGFGVSRVFVKLEEPPHNEVNADSEGLERTATHGTAKVGGKTPRRSITPDYMDATLGGVKIATPDVTRWKLHKIIERPFNLTEEKLGFVYILQSKDDRSFCKVGFTAKKTVEERTREIKCYPFEPVWSIKLKGASRVEALVKEDLKQKQVRVVSCKTCARGHTEWFRIDHVALRENVKGWVEFVQSGIYVNGQVSEAAMCALPEAFGVSPQRLAKLVSSESGVLRDDTVKAESGDGDRNLDDYGGPLNAASPAHRKGLSVRLNGKAKSALQKIKPQPRDGPRDPEPAPGGENAPFLRRSATKIQRRMSSFSSIGEGDDAGDGGGKTSDGWWDGWWRVKKETFR